MFCLAFSGSSHSTRLAVAGISCINPNAPTEDLADGSKSDSTLIIDFIRKGSRPFAFAASLI